MVVIKFGDPEERKAWLEGEGDTLRCGILSFTGYFLCSGDTGGTEVGLVPALCFPLHTLVAHGTFRACSYIYAYIYFLVLYFWPT